MAHKKSSGKHSCKRDQRKGKGWGVKLFGGQNIKAGQIIIRQRGTKWKAGSGVGMGSDYTLFALINGIVIFNKRKREIKVEEILL